MPITFVVDEIIRDAIMGKKYDRAIAVAMSEILKELREIRGHIEAFHEDGICLHSKRTEDKKWVMKLK